MIPWKIYYGNGTTWHGQVPYSAPALNVQAIVQRDDDHGRLIVSGFDYYWFENGQWFGGDLFGLFDHLSRPIPACVKMGRYIPNAEFQAILKQVNEDPDFPPRTARYKDKNRA